VDIDDFIQQLRQTNQSHHIEILRMMWLDFLESKSNMMMLLLVPGTVTLTQTGLIDHIIEALDLDGIPPQDTPANEVLTLDKDGYHPPNATFNYASVIGMVWYLYGHSRGPRPLLSFALSCQILQWMLPSILMNLPLFGLDNTSKAPETRA
jgi:hypothetical protein